MSSQKNVTTNRRSSATKTVVTPAVKDIDMIEQTQQPDLDELEAALNELDMQAEPEQEPVFSKTLVPPQAQARLAVAAPKMSIVFAEDLEEVSAAFHIHEIGIFDEEFPRQAVEKLDFVPSRLQYIGNIALLNRKIVSLFSSNYQSPAERAANRTQSQQQASRFQPRRLGSTQEDVQASQARKAQQERETALAARYNQSVKDGMYIAKELSTRGYAVAIESFRAHDAKFMKSVLAQGGAVIISTPVELSNPTLEYRDLAPFIENGQLLIVHCLLKQEKGWNTTAADRNHEFMASFSHEVYIIQCTSDSSNSGVWAMATIAKNMGTKVRALKDANNAVWKRLIQLKIAEAFYLQ